MAMQHATFLAFRLFEAGCCSLFGHRQKIDRFTGGFIPVADYAKHDKSAASCLQSYLTISKKKPAEAGFLSKIIDQIAY